MMQNTLLVSVTALGLLFALLLCGWLAWVMLCGGIW